MKKVKLTAIICAIAMSLFAAISLCACTNDESSAPDPDRIVSDKVADGEWNNILNGDIPTNCTLKCPSEYGESFAKYDGNKVYVRMTSTEGSSEEFYYEIIKRNEDYSADIAHYTYVSDKSVWQKTEKKNADIKYMADLHYLMNEIVKPYIKKFADSGELKYDDEKKAYTANMSLESGYVENVEIKIDDGKIVYFSGNVKNGDEVVVSNIYQFYNFGKTKVELPNGTAE